MEFAKNNDSYFYTERKLFIATSTLKQLRLYYTCFYSKICNMFYTLLSICMKNKIFLSIAFIQADISVLLQFLISANMPSIYIYTHTTNLHECCLITLSYFLVVYQHAFLYSYRINRKSRTLCIYLHIYIHLSSTYIMYFYEPAFLMKY